MAQPCDACLGRGVCAQCQGKGVVTPPWGDAHLCDGCHGSGHCWECGGSGVQAVANDDDPSYT